MRNFQKKIDPIIEARLKSFISEIPVTLGPTITKTLKEQIANSKDEVVEALYPILGKMIKRYIQNEIKLLSENINKQVNNTFSLVSLKRKVRAKFSGVKEGDLVLQDLDAPKINEVFIIQKGSGILLGNYSVTETVDKDMISGMLTAIKSFIEDAFGGKSQNLENIEYELYNIHIQNFHIYYVAALISGTYTRTFESDLEDKLFKLFRKLATKITKLNRNQMDNLLRKFLSN